MVLWLVQWELAAGQDSARDAGVTFEYAGEPQATFCALSAIMLESLQINTRKLAQHADETTTKLKEHMHR